MSFVYFRDMNDGDILFEIAKRIRAHRLGANLSQDQLAKRIGVGRQTVANAEKGKNIGLLSFIQIVRGLNCFSVDSFLPEYTYVSAKDLFESQSKMRRRASGTRKKTR